MRLAPIRFGDIQQSRTRRAVHASLESEPSAVERPDGPQVGLRSGDDRDGPAGDRVGGVDVAIHRHTRPGRSEPRPNGAGTLRCEPHDGRPRRWPGAGRSSRSPSPIVPQRYRRREDRLTGDVNHGKPPFEEGPGRPLARARGQPEEVVEVVGRPRRPRARSRSSGSCRSKRSVGIMRTALRGSALPTALVDRDRGAHGAERTMEARLGGPQRDAQGGRHLGQRHPQEVVQDDDRAPLRIEVLERLVEQLAVGDRRTRCRRRPGRRSGSSSTSIGRRRRRRMMSMQAWTTSSAQPGVEPCRGRASAGQVPPGADESILDRVARELRVPEDQPGRRVQPRDGRAGERGEGVMIAPLCSFDEVSLVHDSPRLRRDHSVALGW